MEGNICIRLTDAERHQLKIAAALENLSVQKWVRKVLKTAAENDLADAGITVPEKS